MQYGFVIEGGDVHTIAEMAQEAEAAGWDGVFIADAVSIETKDFPAFPWFDPVVVLAAMAAGTERIRIGTMVAAVPRRRPWKMAREAATLDHLSRGRLILGVGVGAAEDDGGFYKVGEAMELKVRAQRLDEGLAIMAGLWRGQPFSFSGEHYQVEAMTMLPPPVQTPRIPIWVVGVWPKSKSLQRALRWDGVIPQKYRSMERMTPAEVQSLRQLADEQRSETTPFDIVVGGQTPGNSWKQAAEIVRPFAESGATWWLESGMSFSEEEVRARLKQGPPRLD